MMDQMGQDPDWERCPVDWDDFPDWVHDGFSIYNSMGAKVYPDVGFIGKDYTNFNFLLETYNIKNKPLIHELCMWLEGREIEKSQQKIKAEYDKIKRKK